MERILTISCRWASVSKEALGVDIAIGPVGGEPHVVSIDDVVHAAFPLFTLRAVDRRNPGEPAIGLEPAPSDLVRHQVEPIDRPGIPVEHPRIDSSREGPEIRIQLATPVPLKFTVDGEHAEVPRNELFKQSIKDDRVRIRC